MKKDNWLAGTGTALITPFARDQLVDYSALAFLLGRQIQEGVDFLVPCGTTGESPTLSHEEHGQVIKFVVKKAAGKIPVLAGTGSNATAEAIALTQAAKSAGADGALVVAPYYNKPTPDGMLDYFRQVAAIGLPVVLYDIPGRCGGNGVSAQTILKLAHEGTIVGLKWASGSLDQLQNVLASMPEGFTVLSGDDNLTFPAMCLGAQGVISVLSNLAPKKVAELVAEIRLGKILTGRNEHFKLLPLMRAMFIETNPIPVKTALAMVQADVFQEVFRSPLVPMEKENKARLMEVLRDYDLLPQEQAQGKEGETIPA